MFEREVLPIGVTDERVTLIQARGHTPKGSRLATIKEIRLQYKTDKELRRRFREERISVWASESEKGGNIVRVQESYFADRLTGAPIGLTYISLTDGLTMAIFKISHRDMAKVKAYVAYVKDDLISEKQE